MQNCEHCGEPLNQWGECKHFDECAECGLMACGFDDHDCEASENFSDGLDNLARMGCY